MLNTDEFLVYIQGDSIYKINQNNNVEKIVELPLYTNHNSLYYYNDSININDNESYIYAQSWARGSLIKPPQSRHIEDAIFHLDIKNKSVT